MDKAAMPEGKYLASVKLGPKGQIVVPKEVREPSSSPATPSCPPPLGIWGGGWGTTSPASWRW